MLPLVDMELDELRVATVCGFPSGAHQKEVKALEAARAIELGAHEVDMVVNLSAVKDGNWDAVYADIAAVREVMPRANGDRSEERRVGKERRRGGGRDCCRK